MNKPSKANFFLVGGGTGGPTAPVLAVAEQLKDKGEIYFIGTKKGPETKLLKNLDFSVKHITIPAGKWRRYFSLRNLLSPFLVFYGFIKSLWLIKKYQPKTVFGAGSFVQVPVCWAAYFLKVPVVIHQQDLDILLSTRLVYPAASRVTTAFRATVKSFSTASGLFKKSTVSKVVYTGNPVRRFILKGSKQKAVELFGLDKKLPTVLVMGGGIGAQALNNLVLDTALDLVQYAQIIHLTGGKSENTFQHQRYHAFDFMGEELAHAYAVSDLVLSRAGMSTISELAVLGKPAVLMPLPDTPQEGNAFVLSLLKCVIGVRQEQATPEFLVSLVRKVLWNPEIQKELSGNIKRLMPPDADKKIAELIYEQIT